MSARRSNAPMRDEFMPAYNVYEWEPGKAVWRGKPDMDTARADAEKYKSLHPERRAVTLDGKEAERRMRIRFRRGTLYDPFTDTYTMKRAFTRDKDGGLIRRTADGND